LISIKPDACRSRRLHCNAYLTWVKGKLRRQRYGSKSVFVQ
jgi:hypothetical protein